MVKVDSVTHSAEEAFEGLAAAAYMGREKRSERRKGIPGRVPRRTPKANHRPY